MTSERDRPHRGTQQSCFFALRKLQCASDILVALTVFVATKANEPNLNSNEDKPK
jgi:hypothetical protein